MKNKSLIIVVLFCLRLDSDVIEIRLKITSLFHYDIYLLLDAHAMSSLHFFDVVWLRKLEEIPSDTKFTLQRARLKTCFLKLGLPDEAFSKSFNELKEQLKCSKTKRSKSKSFKGKNCSRDKSSASFNKKFKTTFNSDDDAADDRNDNGNTNKF